MRGLVMPPAENEMKLTAVATIRTNFPEAHFWIVRRGSAEHCGEAVREFNPEHIGIRIDRTDLLLPDYLFYALTHVLRPYPRSPVGALEAVSHRDTESGQYPCFRRSKHRAVTTVKTGAERPPLLR
ncbi:hypothetical protein ALQ82_05487 [Pseudomonas syringae pv. pisi]|nr:hypothetical protein ALQ82_05487 [Pseudomonas syringae pv. pisi]